MEFFLSDLRHAIRMLRRSPGFAITAAGVLALGIGTNTAVFSVVNTVLLRQVSAPNPGGVVIFLATNRSGAGPFASDIKFNLWREQTSAFADVSGYYTGWFNLTGVENPEQVDAAFVTLDYFHLFGMRLARGRAFTDEEERPGAGKVIILGEAFWKRAFSGDPGIVGKTISLSGSSYEVVGILAADSRPETPTVPDVWAPFPIDPNSNSQVHYFRAIGRLRDGITLQQANAQLQLTTQEFRRRYPNALSTSRGDVFSVEPMRDFAVKNVRQTLLTLAGAVSFVLLIACANVASLLLARASGRRKEIAMRAAVGASRGRIVQQLLTESALLALAGAVPGLGLGLAGIRLILGLDAANLPRIGLRGANVTLDWRLLLFTALVTLLTSLLFGLVPALQASRVDLHQTLKESAGRGGTELGGHRTRSLLVIGEVSVALVSLMGAVLLIRTLIALRSVSPGFDAHNAIATMVTMDPRFAKTGGVDLIAENIFRRLDALPGVENVALTGLLPLAGDFNSLTITIVGRPLVGLAHGNARWMTVSPSYFDVLRIPLVRGRLFTDADRRDAAPVALINQAMADQFWPAGDPLQDRLVIGKGLGQNFGEPPRQVVGIVKNVREDSLNGDPLPEVFVPSWQRADMSSSDPRSIWKMWVIARTRGPSGPLAPAIERELRQTTGGLPVPPVRRMEDVVARSTASQNFNMILMSVFGGCSLLLAAIGIYGLLAQSVQQRSREMGIRMALGAQPGDVRKMVAVQGMRLAVAGACIGTFAALGLTRFIQSFLFGVHAVDPVTFITVPIGLLGVALLAVWLPALRASRIDPADALRSE